MSKHHHHHRCRERYRREYDDYCMDPMRPVYPVAPMCHTVHMRGMCAMSPQGPICAMMPMEGRMDGRMY